MPDLICRLTTPPSDRPNSAEYVLVCSLNSSSASTLGKITTVCSHVSLLSTPSSMKLLSRARWPLAENDAEARQARLPAPSMFAPMLPRNTPGTVRVRLTKLRPLSGSACICSSLTVVPSSDDEVCTSGVWASMVTDSVMAPTSRVASMRARWSTPSSTLESAVALKPSSSTSTT